MAKNTDDYFTKVLRYITDPISKLLAEVVNANIITFISLMVVFLASIYLYSQNYILGGLFIIIYEILDGIDGEIARLRNEKSKFGCWFDAIINFIADPLFIICICLGNPSIISLTIGMFAILAFPMQFLLIHFYKNEVINDKRSISVGKKGCLLDIVKHFYSCAMFDVILGLFLIIGHPLLWLGLWAVGGNIFWMGTLFIQYKELTR